MLKLTSISLYVFLSFTFSLVLGQGLNYEFSVVKRYNQTPISIFCNDEYTFSHVFYSHELGPHTEFYRIDSSGFVTTLVDANDTREVRKMFFEPVSQHLYVLGKTVICESSPDQFYIGVYDTNFIQINKIDVVDDSGNELVDLNLPNPNTLIINKVLGNTTWVKKYVSGIQDSLLVTVPKLYALEELGGYYVVGYYQNTVYGIDNFGNIDDSISFTENIKDLKIYNNEILIITNDSLHRIDNSFSLINSRNYNGFSNFEQLKILNGSIQVNSSNSNYTHVLKLDPGFNISDIDSAEIFGSQSVKRDFNSTQISEVAQFPLARYNSAWFYNHSRQSSISVNRKYSDIALVDITTNAINIDQQNNSLRMNINCVIKNVGTDTITSYKLNRLVTTFGPICGHAVTMKEVTGIMLLPGDSIMDTLYNEGIDWWFLPDSLGYNICAYVSHPNRNLDTVRTNDLFCKDFFFGYLSEIEQLTQHNNILIYPNPTNHSIRIDGLNENDSYEISIFDISGKQIANRSVDEYHSFSMKEFDPGIYIVWIFNGSNLVYQTRIVKQ